MTPPQKTLTARLLGLVGAHICQLDPHFNFVLPPRSGCHEGNNLQGIQGNLQGNLQGRICRSSSPSVQIQL